MVIVLAQDLPTYPHFPVSIKATYSYRTELVDLFHVVNHRLPVVFFPYCTFGVINSLESFINYVFQVTYRLLGSLNL